MKYFSKLIFITTIFAFLVVKLPFVFYKFSDENVYFYLAKLVADGFLPYKDFFFPNPPLHLYFTAFWQGFLSIFRLSSASMMMVLKTLPLVEALVSGLIIYLLVKKFSNPWSALAAGFFYLFSFSILTTTDYDTGVHLASLLVVTAVYLATRQQYKLAGAAAALATLTRLYSSPAVFGLIIYLFWQQKNKLAEFLTALIMTTAIIHGLFILIVGQPYLEQVFFYHFLKSAGISKLRIFQFFARWDAVVLVLAFFGAASGWPRRPQACLPPRQGSPLQSELPLLIILPMLVFYLFFADIYYFYLVLIMPFLAWLASVGVNEAAKKLSIRPIFLLMVTTILLSVYNVYYYVKDHAKTARIDFAQELADLVAANSNENETLYGSVEITPLIAFLSGREIVNHWVDTNKKVFLAGLVDTDKRTEELRGKIRFIISKAIINNDQIVLSEDFVSKDFLANECQIAKIYPVSKDYFSNSVVVFDCQP